VEGDSYYLLPWKWGEKPPEEFDPVVIIPGILGSWEKNGEWVLDPVLQTYDNLINTLLANGYVEGKTLFTFPYDWKNSNITTAFLLKQKIEEIKQVCACEWVDIISHSMGGLVALQYIVRDDYARDVDQLVMIATPLMGAPKAYKTWEGGVIDFGNKLRNAIMSVIFYNEARENGYGNIFDYIRGWPAVSIQELLPVNHNYLSTATTTLEYPNGYPGNLFLETLHTDLITTLLNGVEPLLIRADNLTDSTINGFVVEPSDDPDKWEHGKPVSEVLGPGDGTVPSWSTEEFIGSSVVFAGMDHSVVASSSVSWIFSELNERPVETIVGEKPDVNGSFLFFQLFSPVDMQIVAPDGKRFGKDFVSNTEIAEIPNAFYSGFEGENEYAIILNPLPGEYEVNTIGTEEGEYTIAVDYSNLATTTRAEVRGIAVLGEVIEHTATVSATSTDIEIEKVEEESSSKTCQENVDTARDSGQINQITVYYYLVAECQVVEALSRAREYIPEPADNILRKIIERTTNNIQEHVRGRDKHDGRFR
jgi:pimeloyl-ACP methyl ester carboxylesterase